MRVVTTRRAGFDKSRIFEIHGNVVTWQCGAGCGAKPWTLPLDHRFIVNEDMRAPNTRAKTQNDVSSEDSGQKDEENFDSVGGGGVQAIRSLHRSAVSSLTCYSDKFAANRREGPLQMSRAQQPSAPVSMSGGYSNHVKCARCGRLARPNVLMFEDEEWEVCLCDLTEYVCERVLGGWVCACVCVCACAVADVVSGMWI
jgi:NAD-dependent SIR2 family protein deacetylase